MFQFVTEGFETYMQTKLLSIAHNRLHHFISTKYKGLSADKIDKSSITVLNITNKLFLVNSSRDSKVPYRVDMEIGTCSCDIGKNGTPCCHQAEVVSTSLQHTLCQFCAYPSPITLSGYCISTPWQ